ncbi:MAG TPA: LysR family transcriptional regulator [Myxococcales bacterium]|nr:LysR family transcriptional regulator [Myxococcales bacterium]
MPDWSDLRVFLEVARSGTLAAAARKLGVDSTTVGRRLSALERDLGAKLLARTPDGFALTAAGDAMRAAGADMEQAVLRGEQRALGADRKLSGQVRVATTEMLGETVVLPALRTLRQRHPQIRVELLTGSAPLDVARRDAEVALRFVRPQRGDLVSRRAGTVAFGAYASKHYLAARGRPPAGSGFAGHDVILYSAPIRYWRHGHLGGEPLGDVRVVLRANSTHAILAAVRLGLGIGPLPCFLAASDRALARVPSPAAIELDELWMVVHADVQRTSRVRAVIDAIEARLAGISGQLSGADA